MRVSEAGGQVTPVTGPKQNELQALPQFLPDDRHFIFHSFPAAGAQDVSLDLGSLDSQATRRLTTLGNISPAANSPAIFASPGFILYSRDRTLLAQAFDVAHMSLSGEPSPIAENVRFEFSVSNTGILVYRTAPDSQQPQQSTAQLSWFDRKRKAIGQIPSPAVVGSVRLSQDDQRIAIDSTGPGTPSDIWVIDSRGVPNKITADNPLFDAYPVWSPDASRIVFAAAREKDVTLQLYQRASNGIGIPLRLLPENIAEITMPTDWSLDGQSILFARYAIASLLKINLWVLPTSGDAKPRVLVQNGFANVQAQFSPDSRYIAYTTNEQGSYQIVVQTFPDPSLGKWTITRDGGTEPIWKHDGRELYYLAPDGKIMAVPIKSGATFEAQQPAPLFQSSLRQQQPPFQRRYAVSSDGQRFLMATNASQSGATGNDIPITAVLNWTSILKKK
jgi:Tol biopolymer transport system component